MDSEKVMKMPMHGQRRLSRSGFAALTSFVMQLKLLAKH